MMKNVYKSDIIEDDELFKLKWKIYFLYSP